MMIKVNGEYLDFDDEIETERQIKLFQDIETSNGDFSYSFTLPKTQKNLSIFNNPTPDSVKTIYQNILCDLIDDSGFLIQSGSLMVESITDVISVSFFGGNNDWFGLLGDPLSSLPLKKYDITLTAINIQSSWTKTSGLVFPILDAGALVTRSYSTLKTEDFTPCVYIKSLFKDIFNPLGIKLQGDLLEDVTFNQLIISANARSQGDIQDRSCYVNKTTIQNGITSETKVTFQDETNFPYFDGASGNFNNSTYTADVKMVVRVEINFSIDLNTPSFATQAKIRFYKNSFEQFAYIAGSALSNTSINTTKTVNISLNAGDTVEIYALESAGLGGNIDVEKGSIKITPIYIYKVFGSSSVPNWTQGELVSNILRIFNVLPSYNSNNKTLTLDLFNKIKQKEEIDISDDIEEVEIDYTDFVSNYGIVNIFKYQEGTDEDLRQYNISNFIGYGSGMLTVDNDFIDSEVDVIESDFTSPITYINGAFDMSMERINFVELEDILERSITSVSDGGVDARFNISNADDYFSEGDLVRLETTLDGYNGEWVVEDVTSSYIELTGIDFDASATGTVTLLRHKFTTDDSVYLFVNVPNVSNLFFSSLSAFRINDDFNFQTSAVAYFNLLSTGRQINTKYRQSLSFGSANNPLSNQRTLLDTYWPIFGQILNDPIMLKVIAYFKMTKYDQLKTFLRPLRVRTKETNNLYYLNRISGYQGGSKPCNVELIKL